MIRKFLLHISISGCVFASEKMSFTIEKQAENKLYSEEEYNAQFFETVKNKINFFKDFQKKNIPNTEESRKKWKDIKDKYSFSLHNVEDIYDFFKTITDAKGFNEINFPNISGACLNNIPLHHLSTVYAWAAALYYYDLDENSGETRRFKESSIFDEDVGDLENEEKFVHKKNTSLTTEERRRFNVAKEFGNQMTEKEFKEQIDEMRDFNEQISGKKENEKKIAITSLRQCLKNKNLEKFLQFEYPEKTYGLQGLFSEIFLSKDQSIDWIKFFIFCEYYNFNLVIENQDGTENIFANDHKNNIYIAWDQRHFLARYAEIKDPITNAKTRKDYERLKELLSDNISSENVKELFDSLLYKTKENFMEIISYIDLCKEKNILVPDCVFKELENLKKDNLFYYGYVLQRKEKVDQSDLHWWFDNTKKYLNFSEYDQKEFFDCLISMLNRINLSKEQKDQIQKSFDSILMYALENRKFTFLKCVIHAWKEKRINFTKKALADGFLKILENQKDTIAQDNRLQFYFENVLQYGIIPPEAWLNNIVNKVLDWQGLQSKAPYLFNYPKFLESYANRLLNASITNDEQDLEALLDPNVFFAFASQKEGSKWMKNFFSMYEKDHYVRSFFLKIFFKKGHKLNYQDWKKAFVIALLENEEQTCDLLTQNLPSEDALGGALFYTFMEKNHNLFYKLMDWYKKEKNSKKFARIFKESSQKAGDYIRGKNNTISKDEKELCEKMIQEAEKNFEPFYKDIQNWVQKFEETITQKLSQEKSFDSINNIYKKTQDIYNETLQSIKDLEEKYVVFNIIESQKNHYIEKWSVGFALISNIDKISNAAKYSNLIKNSLIDTPHTGSCWLYGLLTEKNSDYSEEEIRENALACILSNLNEKVKESLKEGMLQMTLSANDTEDSPAKKEARLGFRLFIDKLPKEHVLRSLSPQESCEQFFNILQSHVSLEEYFEPYINVRFGTRNMWGDSGDLKALGHAIEKNILILSKTGFEYSKQMIVEDYTDKICLFFDDFHYQRVSKNLVLN